MSLCSECGKGSSTGVLGLKICGLCGHIFSQNPDLHELAELELSSDVTASTATFARLNSGAFADARPLGVATSPWDRAAHLSQANPGGRRKAMLCRREVNRVVDDMAIQQSVVEPTLALTMKHCFRMRNSADKKPILRRIVAACLVIVSSRQGLGVTLDETAAKVGMRVGELRKTLWKVCKAGGLSNVRGPANVESLMQRLCEASGIVSQRSAIISVGVRLYAISEKGWTATGRQWAQVVLAAFVLSAQAYLVSVDVGQLSRTFYVGLRVVQERIKELTRVLLALLRPLPWGGMVGMDNIHCYLLFAVDFSDVLQPALPELKRLRTEASAASAARLSKPQPIAARLPESQPICAEEEDEDKSGSDSPYHLALSDFAVSGENPEASAPVLSPISKK